MEVIMARITAARQSEHLCLRMTCDQLKELELAANLSGVNLSQWALENLLSCARETITPNNRTIMAAEDFDAILIEDARTVCTLPSPALFVFSQEAMLASMRFATYVGCRLKRSPIITSSPSCLGRRNPNHSTMAKDRTRS